MKILRVCFVACLSLFTNNVLLANNYVYSSDGNFRASKVENRHSVDFTVEIRRDDWQTIQVEKFEGEGAKNFHCSFKTVKAGRHKVDLLIFEKDQNPSARKSNTLAHEYDGLYRLVRKTDRESLSFEEYDLANKIWHLNTTVIGT